ncbi:hypothetical protein BFP70_16635 [Thioclava sp. SK-1]|uniref:histidine kinase dimerization/phosphoacceptor domain -containing protein n=1 Tax=Thioclava sp. SK-1 TaxID=1889770 RepID=UPI0008243E7C|nr:histidine kinase dimerization/phosphoacceptor domain -containing protein [Thioclava sp. SK-1]OCX61076.1 hypothetical protein BFP70_16635 [Thioclava sp. SK-1]
MTAQSKTDESTRIEALSSYCVVGTPAEKEYDDVVRLVAGICDVPIALVSMLEEGRQWFKASVGTDLTETPRDMAICSYTILGTDILEIEDTTKDPRTRANPLCLGDDPMRFYAGMPLINREGLAIGTVCILDKKPRVLTALQRETLRVMAGQVMNQLELRRSLRITTELRGEVDHRVKNSLQSLAALASIKARMAKVPEAKDALRALQRRIQTVAMLHEQLYKADNGTAVDLGGYLSNVARFLESQTPDRLQVRCNVIKVEVLAEQAAAFGTLVNEFVANSIKHGFPNALKGTVTIDLELNLKGEYQLRIRDDGIGLAQGAEPQKGLGLQIMEASAAQANASYTVAPQTPGFGISCTFTPRRKR